MTPYYHEEVNIDTSKQVRCKGKLKEINLKDTKSNSYNFQEEGKRQKDNKELSEQNWGC